MVKLEHFQNILLFEFNEGQSSGDNQKHLRCVCVETMPLERAWQEDGLLVLRRIVLALVTFHIQKTFGV